MATIHSYSFNNNVADELISKPNEECEGFVNPFNKKNVMITTNKIQNILKKVWYLSQYL